MDGTSCGAGKVSCILYWPYTVNKSLCMRGAGYHDGFVIPAGATNIQITEDPVNPSVHFGECVYMLP